MTTLLSLKSAQILAAWMTVSVLAGGFLTLAAVTIQVSLRRTVPFRAVWASALALTLLLSVALPFRYFLNTAPNSSLSLPSPDQVETEASASSHLSFRSLANAALLIPSASNALVHQTSAGAARAMRAAPDWFQLGFTVAWPLMSISLLGLGIFAYRKQSKAISQAQRATIDGHCVKVANVAGPLVVGLLKPTIVVSPSLFTRSAEERALVVAHEQSHIAARDPQLLVAAHVLIALMPWNPAVWFMLSRLRSAIEFDCDARVLSNGISVRRYSELLIEFSIQSKSHKTNAMLPLLSTAFSWRTSQLHRRLHTMTDHTRSSFARRSLAATMTLLAVLAACRSDLPTAAQIDAMDLKAADQHLTALWQPSLLSSDSVAFVVDGILVNREAAMAITADSIRAINIRKDGTNGQSAVLITTGKPRAEAKVQNQPQNATSSETEVLSLAHKNVVVAHGVESAASRPIVFVNGVRSSITEINNLNPKSILNIEVVKGGAALAQYGPEGANGVIRIETKK